MADDVVEAVKLDYSQPWVRGWEYVCQEGSSLWKRLREERGWSRRDVWQLTDGMVTPGRQADFENEWGIGFPDLDDLIYLAVIYGTTPGELLNRAYEEKGCELLAEAVADEEAEGLYLSRSTHVPEVAGFQYRDVLVCRGHVKHEEQAMTATKIWRFKELQGSGLCCDRCGVELEFQRQDDGTARRFRRKDDHSQTCGFGGYNYHGVGEFIAIFEDGKRSSEYIREWEPVDGEWPKER